MSEGDGYRHRAEQLLSRAATTQDMNERGRLIDEALRWHNLALDALGHPDPREHQNDDADQAGDERPSEARTGGGA